MTKKQKKMLCRIIVTAVLVLAIRLFSIGGLARDAAVSGGVPDHRL